MRFFGKGQVAVLPTVIVATLSLIGSIGGSWLSASAAASKELSDVKLDQQKVDSSQDQKFEILKSSVATSACIQNQNIQAIGRALRVNVIDDPNCKK